MSVFIIAEIGINHNGDLNLTKKLIDGASLAGVDAVKFQKRTIERVYTKEELDKLRESPWGNTNRDQKMGLEFGRAEYNEIDRYCREKGMIWLASAWDLESQYFLRGYQLKYNKVASPMLAHLELLEEITSEKKYTFISTGMSNLEDIDRAVDVFRRAGCPFELMHCTSTYPLKVEEINLGCIPMLRERYGCKVGYSGHETGLSPTLAAVAMGASSIERHITLDRAMYGSDQAASVEIHGFAKMVRDIRAIEKALGDGVKRIWDSEVAIAKKLRRARDIQELKLVPAVNQ